MSTAPQTEKTEKPKKPKIIPGPNGGARNGSGRKKGVFGEAKMLRLATKASIQALALQYASTAIGALVEIVNDREHRGRVSAASEILDRGIGKASQIIEGDPDNPIQHIGRVEFILRRA